MRNSLVPFSTALMSVAFAGCEAGPGAAKEAPSLVVTSPTRSLVQGNAGQIMVTGKVTANSRGDAVAKVLVNNVQATIASDGSFSAPLQIGPGSTLIETVASDVNGSTITDTRSVQAGQLTPVGADVNQAVGAALSAGTFTKISEVAGPIIKSIDINKLLAPLQPIIKTGTEGSCNYVSLYLDNLKYADLKVAVSPITGGVTFNAEIDGLDVKSHVKYSILCSASEQPVAVTATLSNAAGNLNLAIAGAGGFNVTANNTNVDITGLNIQAPGLPQTIVDLLNTQLVEVVTERVVELLIGPVLNKAFGALTGPLDLSVLGLKLHFQVVPVTSNFTSAGAVVGLNMKVMIDGAEKSPGFIYTPNQAPSLDRTQGLQLGLSDDLINQLLAELHAIGLLNLSLPQDAGVFDTAQARLTTPPMISADARDGALRLMLGDVQTTFTSHGAPVAKASLNARVNLKITPTSDGTAVGVQLGEPEIHFDMLDDVPNVTGLSNADLSRAAGVVLTAQLDSISKLLGTIPTPAIAGVSYRTTGTSSSEGYVVVSVQLQ